MKKLTILLSLLISINIASAQELCDSTLTVCDSVFIDSVFFTHSTVNGDRIHFDIKSNHQSLYAPSFVICPSDSNITFVNNEQFYFGLSGPINVFTYYEFTNLRIVGDSLKGSIIVNNTNNSFPNCIVSFNTPVQSTTTVTEHDLLNEIDVYPNPVSDYLYFNPVTLKHRIQKIHFLDYSGKVYHAKFDSDKIDLREFPAGIYIVLIELPDKRIVTKKVVLK